MTVFGIASVFFFSSRRRHTRSLRDWSSDVCSSDLYRKKCARLSVLSSLSRCSVNLLLRCLCWVRILQGWSGLLSRSEEHTSELQSRRDLVCRLLLEKKKKRTHI